MITAGADGKIFDWEQPATAQELIEIADAAYGVQDVAFDPRADRLHFIRSGRGVETCDFTRAMEITQLALDDLSQPPVALAPTSDEVLVLSFGNATAEAVELPSQQPLTLLARRRGGPAEAQCVVCTGFCAVAGEKARTPSAVRPENGSHDVVDFGTTEAFQRRCRCPWGENWP